VINEVANKEVTQRGTEEIGKRQTVPSRGRGRGEALPFCPPRPKDKREV